MNDQIEAQSDEAATEAPSPPLPLLAAGDTWVPGKPGSRVRPRTIVWTALPPVLPPSFAFDWPACCIGWVHDPNRPRHPSVGVDNRDTPAVFQRWIRDNAAVLCTQKEREMTNEQPEREVLLTPGEVDALRWLPIDGRPRDRGSAMNGECPTQAIFSRLADLTVGDPRQAVCLRVSLCERVPELDAPREFDEHWRLTPAGQRRLGKEDAPVLAPPTPIAAPRRISLPVVWESNSGRPRVATLFVNVSGQPRVPGQDGMVRIGHINMRADMQYDVWTACVHGVKGPAQSFPSLEEAQQALLSAIQGQA